MRTKIIFIAVLVVASAAVFTWGRFEIRLVIPEDFRGLIRVDERSNGGDLRLLFPSISIDPSGVVHLKTVRRFFGFCRVVAYRKESGQRLPGRFGDEAANGAICFWDLPTSINPEVNFFIGTAKEHKALLEDRSFLQELGRDHRSDPH